MRKVNLLIITLLGLITFSLAPLAHSQDMGIADTVRIGDAVGDIDGEESYPFAVSVYLYNDYDLNEVTIPLIVDGFSGWIRLDSISYIGGRLADPGILQNRNASSFGTDLRTVDSLVLRFETGAGSPLPAGSGKLCDLWFRPNYGGTVLIDSLAVSPYGNLNLVSECARSVGSVIETKSMLANTMKRNLTDTPSPRASPKSVMGKNGPKSPILGTI